MESIKVAGNSDELKVSQALSDIVNLLEKEVEVNTLQSVPFDVYSNAASTIETLNVSKFDGSGDLIRNALVELLSDSIELLFEARCEKMIDYLEAMSTLSTSTKSAATSTEYSKMTDEEKYFLEAARDLEKRRSEILKAVVIGNPKVLESISKKTRSKQTIIMFLKQVEQFMGVDMNKYGPFLQEDITTLPSENARSLIERRFAVEL